MSTTIELFAGAGGAALGLRAAGFRPLALVERDPDACASLRAAGLGPVVEADVRDHSAISAVVGHNQPTLLWSSFPCQPFSQAGKRKSATDERNGWPWTVDAIDKWQPTWFLGENVRGLTFHRKACRRGELLDPLTCPGCYLKGVILPDLRKRFGHAGYWVLDAADYGVPQHRRRVFIWAGPRPLEKPAPTHGPHAPQPWVTVRDALGLVCRLDGGRNSKANPRQERPITSDEPCYPIGTRGNQMIEPLRVIGGGRNPQSPELAHKRNYRDLTDEPCTTIAAVQVGNRGPWVESPTKRRRLTVEECAILQGFPPGHRFGGTTKTSRFRQVGNAVPPPLAETVARCIQVTT